MDQLRDYVSRLRDISADAVSKGKDRIALVDDLKAYLDQLRRDGSPSELINRLALIIRQSNPTSNMPIGDILDKIEFEVNMLQRAIDARS